MNQDSEQVSRHPLDDPIVLLHLQVNDPTVRNFVARHGLVLKAYPNAAPWLAGPGISVGLSMDGTTVTGLQLTGPRNPEIVSPWKDHGEWTGTLPYGLDFCFTREDVWTLLGIPEIVSTSDLECNVDHYLCGTNRLILSFHAETPALWMLQLYRNAQIFEPVSYVSGRSMTH